MGFENFHISPRGWYNDNYYDKHCFPLFWVIIRIKYTLEALSSLNLLQFQSVLDPYSCAYLTHRHRVTFRRHFPLKMGQHLDKELQITRGIQANIILYV